MKGAATIATGSGRRPRSRARWGLAGLAAVVVAAVVAGLLLVHNVVGRSPGCTVTAPPQVAAEGMTDFAMTPEQAGNAATIAGVGSRLGMPDHAVTVALATALQESRLQNLPGGDRDSAGLFQQRPSQGWGTPAQVQDPVHAATTFYQRLHALPNWQQLDVTDAAQLIQRSATPQAYAQWEPQARATAAALTGQTVAALTCHDLTITTPPGASLVNAAAAELGMTTLSGPHPSADGWAISSWLVAHAERFSVEQVSFDGRTWTADSGTWSQTGPADGVLSLRQAR